MTTQVSFQNFWNSFTLIAIILGITFFISLLFRKFLAFSEKKSAKKRNISKRKIYKIIHLPLQIAIWGFGIFYVLEVVSSYFNIIKLTRYIHLLKIGFFSFSIVWIVLRWIQVVFDSLSKKFQSLGVNPGTIYALRKLALFTTSILGSIIVFGILEFDILPLLTFGGIGVAGLAFAAQDVIGNFFGGIMLHFTQVFSIGDMIVIPSKDNFEGVVKEIGWYTTVVEDYSRRLVYFPNALFSKSRVVNQSRSTHRRIKGTITVRYDDLPNIELIVNDLQNRIRVHPDIDEAESFSIQLSNYGQYGVDIFYYLLSKNVNYLDYLKTRQQIFLIMNEVLEKHDAEFCYPTHTVNFSRKVSFES